LNALFISFQQQQGVRCLSLSYDISVEDGKHDTLTLMMNCTGTYITTHMTSNGDKGVFAPTPTRDIL
jgi:hypothetical protein